jgi:hypothetical protein
MTTKLTMTMATGLVVAALGAPAVAADATLQPGTYGQYNPGTKKLAVPGNQLVFVRGKTGRLSFSLNAVRAVDVNSGYVAGTLPANGRSVTWIQRGDGLDCKLTFTASGSGLIVVQDARFGDCGFGYGVLADGQYVKIAENGKLGTANGP